MYVAQTNLPYKTYANPSGVKRLQVLLAFTPKAILQKRLAMRRCILQTKEGRREILLTDKHLQVFVLFISTPFALNISAQKCAIHTVSQVCKYF